MAAALQQACSNSRRPARIVQGCAPRVAEPSRVAKLMSLLPFLQARLASVLQTASLYLAVDAEVGAAGGEGKGRMTLAATAKGRELDPYYRLNRIGDQHQGHTRGQRGRVRGRLKKSPAPAPFSNRSYPHPCPYLGAPTDIRPAPAPLGATPQNRG